MSVVWGIFLKRVEKESLVKSFLLFFSSQTLLIAILFFTNYQRELQTLDNQIFAQMRICSFNLQCKNYKIGFVNTKGHELYKLYKNENGVSSYFSIPSSKKHYLKIYLNKKEYLQKIAKIKKTLLVQFLILEFFIALLSFGFAFYTLLPLRNALRLTEEFIKDILHDFNTPLSTLRLNIAMLKRSCATNKQIPRIENAIATILALQTNLRSYLHSHSHQKEQFDLEDFLRERVALIQENYKDIHFEIAHTDATLMTNKDALTRIIDNLLSNAAKYNKKDGKVHIQFENNILTISDTGKGIRNPKRVFERFYKEQERGIGIGLHIVKKLCNELGIKISVKSVPKEGTSFSLDLSHL